MSLLTTVLCILNLTIAGLSAGVVMRSACDLVLCDSDHRITRAALAFGNLIIFMMSVNAYIALIR